MQHLWVMCVSFLKKLFAKHTRKKKAFHKDLSRKRNVINFLKAFAFDNLSRHTTDNEHLGNVISLLPTLPNVKNFQMKTGKLIVFISVNLISTLTNKDDGQFPAKLNTAHGEVAHMQIDCR